MKLFFVLILSTLLLSCNRVEDQIFILPKNYTGYILVIYNQPLLGEEIKYKRGKRVYEIPANGILKTQFTSQIGLFNSEFYYGKVASENRIPYRFANEDKPIDSIIVCGGSRGTQGKVVYDLYDVGTREQRKQANKLAEMLGIESLTE